MCSSVKFQAQYKLLFCSMNRALIIYLEGGSFYWRKNLIRFFHVQQEMKGFYLKNELIRGQKGGIEIIGRAMVNRVKEM